MRTLALALLALACAPPRPPVPDALPEVDRLEQRVGVHAAYRIRDAQMHADARAWLLRGTGPKIARSSRP